MDSKCSTISIIPFSEDMISGVLWNNELGFHKYENIQILINLRLLYHK